MNDYQDEINKQYGEATAPHYKFVQFLTVLSAGMLGLSAPQQNAGDETNRFLALLSQWSLVGLSLSVICGVIALYGEKMAHVARAKKLERLLENHQGNVILAKQEAAKQKIKRPPAIHRVAFYVQLWVAALAILLLVLSKLTLLLPSALFR